MERLGIKVPQGSHPVQWCVALHKIVRACGDTPCSWSNGLWYGEILMFDLHESIVYLYQGLGSNTGLDDIEV